MELLAFGANGYGDELLSGLGLTLFMASSSFVGAMILGLGLGLIALSDRRIWRAVWRIYRSVMMALPSLLVIFFIYYNLPSLLGMVLGFTPDISALTAGIIALIMVYAAYVGEVLRGAFLNVPRGQYEAAMALGVRPWPRWRRIILPQALRLALPGLGNIWMILIKDTALVSLVGLSDIVRQAAVAANSTQSPFLFYIAALTAFLALAGLSHLALRSIERRSALTSSRGGA